MGSSLDVGLEAEQEFDVEGRALPAGQATVGFEVAVKHVAPALRGSGL